MQYPALAWTIRSRAKRALGCHAEASGGGGKQDTMHLWKAL
jgi:hypothetical protein